MINFGPMEIEGFASISNEKFDWGLHGLNIIQAPNGYGKTKFINALVWCIYGKLLSGSVEPWSHIRPSSYRGTRVKQMIYVDSTVIKIIRHENFSKLKNSLLLYINDNENPEEGDKRDIQKRIEQIIGYSYDLFKNSIIFGQKLKRIISETGPNKKKIFDEAFEIAYISKAKKLADGKLQEFRIEELKTGGAYSLIEEKVRGKESELGSQKLMVENFENNKKREIKIEREIITSLRIELRQIFDNNDEADLRKHEFELELEIFEHDCLSDKEILALEKNLTKLESEIDRYREEKDKIKLDIKSSEEDLKYLPEKCDKCGRFYSSKEKEEQISRIKLDLIKLRKTYENKIATIGALKRQIKEVEKNIASANKLLENITSCKSAIKELDVILKSIEELNDKVEIHKNRIQEIKERKLENNIEKLSVELRDLKIQLRVKAVNLKRIQRDVKTYEWLIRDPLSNAGLKVFIFNRMLDDVNERLEFYTKFIDFQVFFFMDMKSANKDLETYVFKNKEPVPYDDLSGGQQQTVDIVSAFAIHDVVSDTKECSLLVMDEIFESLDKDNIEIITDLIQDKAQSKCLYLVTHRAEFNPTNANIILIDYLDGITSLA